MSGTFWYQAAAALAALALAGTACVNFLFFRKPKALVSTGGDDALPLISILVPARDEEASIEACVRSLLALNYPRFEVLVLDDNSSDDTYPILCKLRDQDYRLRVLVGAALPDDWCGKPFACWQLAQAARSEFFLFTDADCRFSPDALLLALGARQTADAELVSLIPQLECEGFWERLIIPLQYFIVFAFLPTPLIRKFSHPWFAAANGAFLFLSRDDYFAVDGHRAVRGQLAEDVKFAQHWKRQGKTLWYGDGSRTYVVRMYHGLSEIWAGFSKNLFPAFSHNLPLLLSVLGFIICVLILPLFFMLWGLANDCAWKWWAVGAWLCPVAIRWGLGERFPGDARLNALFNPLAWVLVVGMALNSLHGSLTKRGNAWKGRVYRK